MSRGCVRTGNATDLGRRGCGNADEQTTRLDRRDELARGVGAQDKAHVGHVLLHRPTQRRLRIAREAVGLVDDDN